MEATNNLFDIISPYFPKGFPAALAATSPKAREVGELHPAGVLRCKTKDRDGWKRRRVHLSGTTRRQQLESVTWWLIRPPRTALSIALTIDGASEMQLLPQLIKVLSERTPFFESQGVYQTFEFTFRNINSCESLVSLCPVMDGIHLHQCTQLNTLAPMNRLQALSRVHVQRSALADLEPLRSAPLLMEVELQQCDRLVDIDPLEGRKHLQVVRVLDCPGVTDITALYSCDALREVSMAGCQWLPSLEGLQDHTQLTTVDASRTAITTLDPLASCTALQTVRVNQCRQLTSVVPLEGLPQLHTVEAQDTMLTSLDPLVVCPSLRVVDVRGRNALASLAVLRLVPGIQCYGKAGAGESPATSPSAASLAPTGPTPSVS